MPQAQQEISRYLPFLWAPWWQSLGHGRIHKKSMVWSSLIRVWHHTTTSTNACDRKIIHVCLRPCYSTPILPQQRYRRGSATHSNTRSVAAISSVNSSPPCAITHHKNNRTLRCYCWLVKGTVWSTLFVHASSLKNGVVRFLCTRWQDMTCHWMTAHGSSRR